MKRRRTLNSIAALAVNNMKAIKNYLNKPAYERSSKENEFIAEYLHKLSIVIATAGVFISTTYFVLFALKRSTVNAESLGLLPGHWDMVPIAAFTFLMAIYFFIRGNQTMAISVEKNENC